MKEMEYTIGSEHNRDSESLQVSVDRLSLIGYIGVWSNRLRRFPLPMMALDGVPQITRYDDSGTTTVEGLLPSETEDSHLLSGSWIAKVDIRSGNSFGVGDVYLGNGNTPSNTYGVIFQKSVPYDPELELGFVAKTSRKTVLDRRLFNNIQGYLIYAIPQEMDELDRTHHF